MATLHSIELSVISHVEFILSWYKVVLNKCHFLMLIMKVQNVNCVQHCWYDGNYNINLKNIKLTSASDPLLQPLRKNWLVEWVTD